MTIDWEIASLFLDAEGKRMLRRMRNCRRHEVALSEDRVGSWSTPFFAKDPVLNTLTELQRGLTVLVPELDPTHGIEFIGKSVVRPDQRWIYQWICRRTCKDPRKPLQLKLPPEDR
jgi:hypothetical protein